MGPANSVNRIQKFQEIKRRALLNNVRMVKFFPIAVVWIAPAIPDPMGRHANQNNVISIKS